MIEKFTTGQWIASTGSASIQAHYRPMRFAPLLPWLLDPDWANTGWGDRLNFIHHLATVNLPESVPGLMAVLGNGEDSEVAAAAKALLKYEYKEAVPALEAAVERFEGYSYIPETVQVIHKLDGFSDAEILASLRSYVVHSPSDESEFQLFPWAEDDDEPMPLDVRRGKSLSEAGDLHSDLVDPILEMARALPPEKAEAARRLRDLVAAIPCEASNREFKRRLRAGDLHFSWVPIILANQKYYAPVAAGMKNLTGEARGLQVAVARSSKLAKNVLTSEDRDAKQVLFACARLLRFELPVELISPMVGQGDETLLMQAVIVYLEAIDSPASRALMHKKMTNPDRSPFRQFGEWGDEFSAGFEGDDEMFALFNYGGWGDMGQRFISIRDGQATFVHDEGYGRYHRNDFDAGEVANLRQYVEKYSNDLPPYTPVIHDGIQFTVVHITSEGSREVFMNNPPFSHNRLPRVEMGSEKPTPPADIYGILADMIFELGSTGTSTLHYHSAESIPGFKILVAREDTEMLAISREGGILEA